MQNFEDKIVLITGSSRGIGREIALKVAKEGATVIITGKSTEENPKLPGTIFTVAEEVNQAGGKGVAMMLDVRDETQIRSVVDEIGNTFGRIDILVNNASAIQLTNTINTPMRRFDLMFDVNARATFACGQACIPLMEHAENPHILTLSPPLNLEPRWFKANLPYTLSKYGMSMCTLGWSEELRSRGIAANSLWPRTTIATMAIKAHFPEAIWQASRHPAIVADAAHWILLQDSRKVTGNFFVDDEVLAKAGVTDLEHYALNPGKKLCPDFFL